MAMSLLQEAQTRNLAAALAGMQREDVERSLSLSPPMSANNSVSALYPSLHQAAAASLNMLSSSQLLVANRQAAAAFMAAQMPISTLATTFFPSHPATLLSSWAAAANTATPLPLTPVTHSPPASPVSPITTYSGKHGHDRTSPTSSTHNRLCGESPPKKVRKLSVKKDLITPSIDMSMHVGDVYNTPAGPISPPSSGSSPNSTHGSPSTTTSAITVNVHKDTSRDKSFTCKICSRSFGYKHVLQNHERTHTGEKPFECPECHKRFTRDHHLKTHMRLHTGEKPYHCSHCDRQFVQVANLRRHLRVHTGERPYTCEICEGKFSDSNQLKSHMLVHNGEKPFECDRCHMKFRRRHHLVNHKCGMQTPPTPAISPAISTDYVMSDQRSALSSSFGSEESMDIGKPSTMSMSMSTPYDSEHLLSVETPLDLSEEGADIRSIGRKAHELHNVFRLPAQIMHHISTEIPEQTEPEDLSMRSSRCSDSMIILHNNINFADFNSAAAIYMRHQLKKPVCNTLVRTE